MAQVAGDEAGTTGEKRRAGLTARSVLHAVARRPLTLLGVVALAAGVGAAVWFFLPLPKSTAAVVFYVPSARQTILGGDGTAEGGGNSFRQSQVTYLKRRLTLIAVLNKDKVKKLPVVLEQPDPVAWLEYNLKFETKLNSEFIRVTLEGNNPVELTTILDALAEQYLKEADDRDNGARRHRLATLEDQNKKEYRARIEEAYKRIDTIALALGSKDGQFLALKDSMMRREYDEAVSKWNDLRNQPRLVISAQEVQSFTPWTSATRNPGAVVTDRELDAFLRRDPTWRQLEAGVAQERQALADTEALFQPGQRPLAVVQAEEKLKTAEAKLKKYRDDRIPEIEAESLKEKESRLQALGASGAAAVASLDTREKMAKKRVDLLEEAIERANKYRLQLDTLKSEISHTEKLSDALTETIERIKLELKAPARVSVADEPHTVPGLEGNRRLKFTLLAALAFLAVGFAAVVGWDHRARRFTDSSEVPSALGLRLLGSVPSFNREAKDAAANHPVLVESIDATRTMLVHGTDHPDLRVLVVTSAVSGEGKTSLTGHLAISLARAGYRTLLVDGDLRAPTAQKLFDVPLGPGLCELLEDRADVADAVRPTGMPNLSVLTAGQWTASTRQALVGDRWRLVKDRLKGEFDYLVIDTSPLLLVSDALLLAREADGVVVSVLLGVSQVALVDEAVARLQSVRSKVIGVIANGARQAAHQYTHGYRYAQEAPAELPLAAEVSTAPANQEGK